MIDQAQYLQERIDDQIGWYDAKSRRNRRCYRTIRILGIIIALSIPIVSGALGGPYDAKLKVVISLAGALVALLEGLLSLYKFHENWIQYRSTAESLKYHKFLFITGAAPYHEADAFSLFVQHAEGVMAKEHMGWVTNQSAPGPKQPNEPKS